MLEHMVRKNQVGFFFGIVEQFDEIARSKFHAWKRRFRLMETQHRSEQAPALPAFLPVTVRVLETPAGQPPPIEADLPNGVRLCIPTANAVLACRLVRAIAGAKTNYGGSR